MIFHLIVVGQGDWYVVSEGVLSLGKTIEFFALVSVETVETRKEIVHFYILKD